MPPRPRPLAVELLEDRDVPSTTVWNTPWPDGQRLTLSLAPDGTQISGVGSSLSSVLAEAGSAGDLDLLEAFQTWADVANVNFGLVSDGGQAFGVARAIQDDPRFGDIRIGARPLDSDVIALTSPFDYFNTYSGNVVLNSAQPIGTTYNLYTVALHEAGHALGLPDNSDPTSVMYEYYNGTNGALSASDIAAIQGLYGARPANAANDSFATALNYTAPVSAALNSSTDADYYKFTTPPLFTGTTIHLQAEGMSLLDATVSVYSSNGRLVASTTATSPTSNDLTLQLSNLNGLSTYYVVVNSPNGGVFDVGTYDLSVTNNLLGSVGDALTGTLGLLGNVGHTLSTATNLIANTTSVDVQVNYNARSSLVAGTQNDYYAVQAPASSSGLTEALVASVWTLTNQNLTPRVSVFDNQGNPVAFQVLTDTSGASTIQVANAIPGERYVLEVNSSAKQTGNYSLSVAFLSAAIEFPLTASGTLSASASSTSGSLILTQSQSMHFVLTAGANSDANTILQMTIVDSSGNVVATLQTTAGNAESLDLFLGEGTYTITVSDSTTDGSALTDLSFELAAIGITDPVGVAKASPSSTASGSSSSSASSTSPASSSSSSSTPSSSSTASFSSNAPSGNATWN